jgi:hypothetical protein
MKGCLMKYQLKQHQMKMISLVMGLICCLLLFANAATSIAEYAETSSDPNPNPPDNPVRLIFIHHSTGENWLNDENGGLGIALRDNNYFVSDTNYGWGPDGIGDLTDIGNWWEWFRGPDRSTYLNALYSEGDQHCSYSRLSSAPSGENEMIMFKSCFPNSAFQGNQIDPVPPIGSNPLKGEGSGSEYHTFANAKGIYIDILEYFRSRQDKLFIAIAAPPLIAGGTNTEQAANARAFNNWLVNEWLSGYPYHNVAVFDFYNVLTSNGGNANTNDLGWATGNHHRWRNGAIQHIQTVINNMAAYPTSDSHPSQAGNLKATGEFVSLLNIAYHLWKGQTIIYVSLNGTCNDHAPCFNSIQSGINAAGTVTRIMATQETYIESVVLDSPKEITLEGGWDPTFATIQSNTILNGSLTISNGSLILDVGGLIVE